MTTGNDRKHARRLAEQRGRRGEWLAIVLLVAKGYRILARRVRTRLGEIDLVARSPGGILCFIEVKARSDTRAAALSVSLRQQARIARAAELFVAGRPGLVHRDMRFDVIAVSPFAWPRHYPDAWRRQDAR